MLDINPKPSEDPPVATPPAESVPVEDELDTEVEDAETLIVAPPSLRERIQAAQRARTLQNQPTIEEPKSPADSEVPAE